MNSHPFCPTTSVRGAPPASAPRTEVVGQKGWEFTPYVTAVRAGSKVEFPNLDRTTHHVKSFSPAKEFEFFLAADKGPSPVIEFDKPGAVVVYCTLHDWMRAYVYVVDTPWFAKSADTGTGTVKDLPNGTYKLTAWHPDLGSVGTPLTQTVTLKDGASKVKFDFALTPRKPRTPKVLPQA